MTILRRCLTVMAALLAVAQLTAANTKTTVSEVNATVTLTDDVDYIVTSETPFGDNGIVNIENTDNAVLILKAVKPSAATKLLAGHVQINGVQAVNNTNCQVKLYNRGCIILPYGNSTKPLTVYSEPNFEGESANNFGLDNDGGFMNTLTDKQLNNRIRSFKLKRGYMVTFSLKAKGRGYSRCFIAADADLEVAKMPIVLDRSISSYRIFKWYDAGKPALANDTRANVVDALNATSCYSFSLGESRLPNAECVPHHIYENWPSAEECGKVNYSPHLKTNNEPGNSADDHPQTVKQILDNWEFLMATGMRLCSPSSHDGSLGHLREFMDSIDARGWRCDIIDLHCYWPESSFNEWSFKTQWVDKYQRPIWISEWVWGASWNNNGIFGVATGDNRDNPTQGQLIQNRDAVQRICNQLNNWDYIERYFYWNSEANCSKLYYNNKLTPAGEMYAKLDGGLAYKGTVGYVPKLPKQQAPKDLDIYFDKKLNSADFTWYEYNGEMNEYINLECSKDGGKTWEVAADLYADGNNIEMEGLQIVRDIEARTGWQFRVAEKDGNGYLKRSNIVMAASDNVEAGDAITIDGKTMYLGGNILTNGDFSMQAKGWTDGKGNELGQPWFQVTKGGGVDDTPYLQSLGNASTIESEMSVKTAIALQPQKDYYFSATVCNLVNSYSQLLLSTDGKTAGEAVASLTKAGSAWNTQFSTFNSQDNAFAILGFRSLNSKAQFDNITICQLFENQDEAIADGADKLRQRIQAFAAYMPELGTAINKALTTNYDSKQHELESLTKLESDICLTIDFMPVMKKLCQNARILTAKYAFPGRDELIAACDETESLQSQPDPSLMKDALTKLEDKYNAFMMMETAESQVKNPSFASTSGWQTKAGTYQGGDQRINNKDGKTFWNAWWNIEKTGNENQTMAIRQQIDNMEHGLYALLCLATTEHYCLSDQHGYITNGTDSLASPTLTLDLMDIPNTDPWEQLVTLPLYVDEDGSVTIGFEGSKQGATDLAWRQLGGTSSKGDHREGWWAATDFTLLFHPLYRREVTAGQYDVACLPYAVTPSPGITFYNIVAITADRKSLCLQPISQTEAGVPFVFKADSNVAYFMENGEKTTKRNDGPFNLRGFFKVSSSVPAGAFALTNGVWQKVGSTDRPAIGNFRAFIRKFSDSASKPVTIVESWTGETMPIEGVTEEDIEASVNGILNDSDSEATLYTLKGQKAADKKPAGIYIKVKNHKATKHITK